MITNDIENDLEIPDEQYTFGTLISAQATGDFQALLNADRRVIRLHIIGDLSTELQNIYDAI